MNPSDLPRIIILPMTIIDRGNGMIIERDKHKHNKLWLYFPGMEPHVFEDGEAIELWSFFDRDSVVDKIRGED